MATGFSLLNKSEGSIWINNEDGGKREARACRRHFAFRAGALFLQVALRRFSQLIFLLKNSADVLQ